MYHKLSNTASGALLEREFHKRIKYPHLYRKQVLINGLGEATIPIITMEEDRYIVPAIWGILPTDHARGPSPFQDIFRSLSLRTIFLDKPPCFTEAFLQRRCLIPVTGFFSSYLLDEVLYPYYFHQESGLPFCLAGIYNKMDDGFLNCAILTSPANGGLCNLQHIDRTLPVALPKTRYSEWLDPDLHRNEIRALLSTTPSLNLIAYPISIDFFKNGIPSPALLRPESYPSVPPHIVLDQEHFLQYSS